MTQTVVFVFLIALIVIGVASGRRKPDRINAHRERIVHQLDRGLVGSPMAGTGRSMEASGFKWRVNPALMGAIAAKESTLGRAACRNDRFNVVGMNSCLGWRWSGCTEFGERLHPFLSWARMYDYYARYLARCWPSARTPWDLHRYAAVVGTPSCSTCWGSKVAGFMRDLFGSSSEVRYGAVWAVA